MPRRREHRHHCNEDPGGRISDQELYHSKREFNHKTATERDKATVEKSLLALNWIRVSWFRAAALPASTTPASSTPSCAACSRFTRAFRSSPPLIAMPEMSQSEIHAGKRCLKQLRPNEQATFECGLCQLAAAKRRVRQVAVGKACVPYFRGAEVAITRNAVDQRYVEQKRFRERCANELAVERRVRSSEAFCRFTFEQSQCSKTQSMNAARSSAMPLMRQPVKRQFRNVSPGDRPPSA